MLKEMPILYWREECEECGDGQLVKNQKMEEIINKGYKVKCNICLLEMPPNQFHQHLEKKECKNEINNNEIGRSKEKMKIFFQLESEKVSTIEMIDYPLYTRLIYLLIGVGKYQDEKMDLKAPLNDVEEMQNCLGKIGFEKNDKNLLLNEKACKSDIEMLMERFKEEMDGNNEEEKRFNSHSMVIFYFSGHGMKDEQKEIYQICPHDYQFGSRENGINLEFLVESLLK